ncbi:MAG: ATP synthase F1 subunit delta [Candidatus Moranbacteria bacterium]|jgi:F-type H+-transporting ATPase subunit delta|nr:ATP synthase F1 subunit delta [Candidatus Moranbacteria bacterium]
MKISTKQYAQALYELTLGKSESEVGIVVEKFVKELVKNNQIKSVSKIIDNFNNIYNQENGIIEAEIESREQLQTEVLEKIEKYLIKKYKAKQIILNKKINPEIKGGVIIKAGDEMTDLSVAGSLNRLRRELIN